MTPHALVLAGGRGTRFWPLSRRARPKQVLAVGGGESLLARTLARAGGLAEGAVVVTGPDMEAAVRAESGAARVIVEPSGRNTLPAIAWGTLVAAEHGADTVMVLPSDHHVSRPEALREALGKAIGLAQSGALVTLGVRPTRAETGFGWIEADGNRVARFVEKPPQAVADSLYLGGRHLWNAGMFVFRVDAFRVALARHAPATAAALDRIAGGEPVAACWSSMDATSIDYAVMEKHDDVRVVPLDCGWSDVGSWTALDEVVAAGPGGALVCAERVAIEASGNLVHAEGKLVALVGVHDLVVVDTPDALLVMRRDEAQRAREVLADLDARGLSRYT
ncbi:MAG: mannose-1-phosphate guanylyltransferase [Deltaproteobacteria bacterium]|nr:mannose-1-phosphate guanylyltransferase [Deltaproteobacteria bacterium]